MKILLAPDKFKGTATAEEVIRALCHGLMAEEATFEIMACPMADGGDGSLEVLKSYHTLEERTIQVRGPYYNPVFATYLIGDGVAYIEMAKASGIALVPKEELNTISATSYGTGELIKDAIQQGVTEIILFVGGSATTDAGIGMASALGFCFYDEHDKLLEPIGENLLLIHTIEPPIEDIINTVKISVVCDVTNPMFGPQGAAYVYGPQKGATEAELTILDKGLKNLHAVIKKDFGVDVNVAGAGAAGALAGGAIFFVKANLIKGIDLFIETSNITESIRNVDVVITGEGRIDDSSLQGKVISGVMQASQEYGKKVILVCGQAQQDLNLSKEIQVETILNKANDVTDAMTNWNNYLVEIGRDIAKNLRNNGTSQ